MHVLSRVFVNNQYVKESYTETVYIAYYHRLRNLIIAHNQAS